MIDENNEQIGVIPTAEAIRMARETGVDLVEVSPHEKPPVCRLMDFGKWKYKQKKKEQKSHAASHQTVTKELRIRSVRIDDNDQNVKLNQAKRFLDDGHKVQFTLQFRGREMAHVDLGLAILNHFKTELDTLAKPEREPKLEGKRMIMILAPRSAIVPPVVKPHAPKPAAPKATEPAAAVTAAPVPPAS